MKAMSCDGTVFKLAEERSQFLLCRLFNLCFFFIFEEQFIESAVSVIKNIWYISDVVQFFASESSQYFEVRSIADNESIVLSRIFPIAIKYNLIF